MVKDIELAVRQLDAAIAVVGFALDEVDGDGVEHEALGLGARAPEDGTDARMEFLELERLGDVVVHAERERLELVFLPALRRDHDDRRSMGAPALTQLK